jgi:hypothetical protein
MSHSCELALQGAELIVRELITKAARAAVREKRHAAIAQSKDVGGAAGAVIVADLHRFAFAEMIATAVGTELAHLVLELGEPARADEEIETRGEVIALVVVAEMEGILAALRPLGRDAEIAADVLGRAFNRDTDGRVQR